MEKCGRSGVSLVHVLGLVSYFNVTIIRFQVEDYHHVTLSRGSGDQLYRVTKNTRLLLNRMTDGRQDRYVVMRDNRPAAVLISTTYFEAMVEELEDLRIQAIAAERLASV